MDTYELGPFCLDTHGLLLRGSEPVGSVGERLPCCGHWLNGPAH